MKKAVKKSRGLRHREVRPKRNADPRWLKARRALLSRYKRQARALEGREPVALRAYRERHARSLRGPWSPCDKADLLDALASAEVAFAGDFHSLPQAQRAHLRALRALPPGRRVTVAFECFAENAQRALDRFARGDLDAAGLRRASAWDRRWGFPWEGYCSIAELARARGWKLLALSPAGLSPRHSLRARDAFAGRRIAEELKRAPGSLVYALFGELHLAPGHLPAATAKAAKAVGIALPKTASIHLNPERVYFALARRGLESSVDACRAGRKRFCLMASPPWVQWQAHWMHLQRSADEGLFAPDEGYDYDDHLAELIRVAAADLGVEPELAAGGSLRSDFSVYSSEDERIWRWLERGLPRRARAEAAAMAAEGRSFYLPKEGVFYLARSTVNHASELAGQYVHAKLSRREKPLWRMPEDFEGAVWRDAVGFFVSKLMNPQRRGETLQNARERLAALRPKDRGRDALLLALDRRMRELLAAQDGWPEGGPGAKRAGKRSRPSGGFAPRRKSSWREAARILGGMMGERLYGAFRSRSLSLEGIVELLRMEVDRPGFARCGYPALVRLLGPRFEPSVRQKERL